MIIHLAAVKRTFLVTPIVEDSAQGKEGKGEAGGR